MSKKKVGNEEGKEMGADQIPPPEAQTMEPLPEAGSDGDIFKHPELLRIDPSYLNQPVAKKLLTTIPIRKPNKQDFIRVCPDANYRLLAHLVELRDERETYFVAPRFAPELGENESFLATLHLCVNRQRVWFIWPVKMPSPDGRANSWQVAAADAAVRATEDWIRVIPNMSLGAYDIHVASAEFPPPEWPEIPFMDVLSIAFKGRVIDSHDHPVVKRLRGLQ